MSRCSWYQAIEDGKAPVGDPDECCKPAKGKGKPPRLEVKLTASGQMEFIELTAETPEASTVDKPTRPPGGPGLFHVKGLHLPPYIQHLWFHLKERYGPQKAYGVAVGVVKKWAAGVNPGGFKTKSGKGKRTHPDVKAAAQKNIAQWEADKAKAHEHVKASMMSPLPGAKPFPGDHMIKLPATPSETRQMFTVHRLDDIKGSLSHAAERMAAARKAGPELRGYQMTHVCNHLAAALNSGHALVASLRKNYPAEGRELDQMSKVMDLARSLTPRVKAATTAHLLNTMVYDMTHAKRHADLMRSPSEPADVWDFNADHCEKHLTSALNHTCKLEQHIKDNYPTEARYLRRLHTSAEVEASAAAMWPSGRAYKDSFLTPPREDKDPRLRVISQPGGRLEAITADSKSAVLKQEPAQTISPSPPLPPEVKIPTPAELTSFASQLRKLEGDDDASHHIAGAVLHLTSAAEKIDNNPVSALYSLRSAQMAIQNEWRERVMRANPRIAYVFSVDAPPAEQAEAQRVQAAHRAYAQQLQGAASKIADMIGRVRRMWFRHAGMEPATAGGGLAGQPNARLTAAELALAAVRSYQRTEAGRAENVRGYQSQRPPGWIPPAKWAQGQQTWEKRGRAAWRNHRIAKMMDLASSVGLQHDGAAQAIDKASQAAEDGRDKAAFGHLDNAAFLLHASGLHDLARQVEDERDAWEVGPDRSAPRNPAYQPQSMDKGEGPARGESDLDAFEREMSTPSDAEEDAIEQYLRTHPDTRKYIQGTRRSD